MILGVLLTLTLAVTLSVIVVMNYASTDASAQTTASCDDAQTWTGIVPDCLSPGDTYRIIFVTSGERDATSADIADYNAFVQTQAVGTPLADITFNALGSTETVDARDNTMTTGSGERIFYYDGRKVADDYADLYDGTWDTNEPRNQNGGTIGAGPLNVWTGSTNAGEAASTSGGAARSLGSGGQAAIGNAKDPADPNAVGPILTSNSSTSAELPLYALSEVLTVPGSCDDEAPTWTGIIPDCLSPGDSYRILFLTSDMRDAMSTDIADYNTFVQGQADGVTALNGITFRVLASTGSDSARDNTMTTGAGANIRTFYYQGAKVADDYTDLYDGDWDTTAARHQNGDLRTSVGSSVWTGTNEDGTGNSGNQLGTGNPRIGNADVPVGTPLDDAFDEDNAAELFFFALSDVLTMPAVLTLTTATLTIAENEMPEFTVSFTTGTSPEPVQVDWGVDCGSDAGIVSADDFSGNVCPTGTITIDTDRNSSDPFSIPLMDDTLLEGNETLRLRLLTTAPMAFNGNDIQIGDALLNYNIMDNDNGVVSVTVEGSSEILEGDAPTITFNVDLSGGVTEDEDIVVSWELATACVSDNAVGISAADFMGGTNPCDGGTVTIGSGGTSATFAVQIVDDMILEGNEDFTVSLTDISVSTNIEDLITISNTNAVVTIMDDDTPVITIGGPSSVAEGSDAIFTFTLGDRPLTENVDLVWNLMDVDGQSITRCINTVGEGTNRPDFGITAGCASGQSGMLPLPMTDTVNTVIGMVEIPIIADSLIEGPEMFLLQIDEEASMLGAPPVLIITNTDLRSDVVTIDDGDASGIAVSVSTEDVSNADENVNTASFRVFLLLPADEDITVDWAVTCGNSPGITDADFGGTCPSGQTVIPSRESFSTFAITTIADDDLIEGDEPFTLALTGASGVEGASFTTSDTASYTIEDNDDGVVGVTVEGSSEVSEGDTPTPTITFNVGLTGVGSTKTADEDIVVNWELATACVLTNAAGIAADDFTTATNPCSGGTVTIDSGGNSATFTVEIADDTISENNEEFAVTLSSSVSPNIEGRVTISDTISRASVTIRDDDAPVIAVSAAISTVDEGSEVTFTFTLGDRPLTENVDLVWTIADCSTSETAGIDIFDFTNTDPTSCPGGMLTLPMTGTLNTVIGTAEISIVADDLIEGPETFQLQVEEMPSAMGSPSVIIDNQGIVTINDGEVDSTVMLGLDTATAAENFDAIFTASFDPGITADEAVTVNTAVTCDASPGIIAADFVGSVCGSGSITIPAGMNDAMLVIDILDDDLIEGDEDFTLELTSISSGVDGANLAVSDTSNTATRTITDNDEGVVSVTVLDPSAVLVEGATPTITFRVDLTGVGSSKTADEDIVVNWELATACVSDNALGITAADFMGATNPCDGGTVTIGSGGSAMFAVQIADDDTFENPEKLAVSLMSVSPNMGGRVTTATTASESVTITDDDAARLTIRGPSSVEEDSSATFTFTLGEKPLTRDVVLVWNTIGAVDGNDRDCINSRTEGPNGFDFNNLGVCPTGMLPLPMTDTVNTVIGTVEIPVRADSLIEGPEMFLLEIDATSTLGDPPVLIIDNADSRSDLVTINDEEASNIAVTVSTEDVSTADESVGTAVFRVSLPSGITADADITVDWAVTCGNSPGITVADFGGTCPSGQTVIPSRAGFKTFAITTIADDDLIEGNEELTLRLTSAGGVEGASLTASDTTSYTIEDNDRGFVSISTTAAETSEESNPTVRTIRFDVNLTDTISGMGSTKMADEDIGVTFTPRCVTDNGLGITSADFVSPQNLCDGVVITIAGGTNIGSLELTIANDTVVEDDEILISSISLAGPNFDGLVTVGSPSVASLTIVDDDAPRLDRIGRPASVDEGSTVGFTLNFDKALPADVTLAWFVPFCSSSRVAGLRSSDFSDTATACPSGTASLMSGATSGVVSVAIRTDSLLEGSESFRLRIDEARSMLGTPQALRIDELLSDSVMITDTDRAELRLEGLADITEGDPDPEDFMITLVSEGTTDRIVADRAIRVIWDIEDCFRDTSTGGIMAIECPSGSGTETIPEGSSAVQLEISTMDDEVFELGERFAVSLSSTVDVVGYLRDYSVTVIPPNGKQMVLILNNDEEVLISPPPTGSSTSNIRVTTRKPSGRPDSTNVPTQPVTFPPVMEESVPPPPRGVLFVPESVRDINIDQADDAFYNGSEVCLGITEEAIRAVRGRVVSLSLYHYDATDGAWERLEDPVQGRMEEKICGRVDSFSLFALGYPAPVERSNLSILLPPTGGVTLSLWVLFGSGLLGLAVVSGGVFGLRRRR